MRTLLETLIRSCAGLTPDEKKALIKVLATQVGEPMFTQAEVEAKVQAKMDDFWKDVEMQMKRGIVTVNTRVKK